jgi:agmatinase
MLFHQPPYSRKSADQNYSGGYNVPLDANPFASEIKVLDCGDIPVTSYITHLTISEI